MEIAKIAEKKLSTIYASAVVTWFIKYEVLMFQWSRKSKLCHFANYNVSVVARYDRDFGPGETLGPKSRSYHATTETL